MGHKGTKNTIDGRKLSKRFNMNLDNKDHIITTKDIPSHKEGGKWIDAVNSGAGVTVDEWDEAFGGKAIFNSNVGKKAPDWAKKQLRDFKEVWNNVFSDKERSNFDYVRVNWKETSGWERKYKDGITYGSVMARKIFPTSSNFLERPSVLTINMVEGHDMNDILNITIHEKTHGVWNDKVKNNKEKLDKFTDEIFSMGRDEALTPYVDTYYKKYNALDNDLKKEIDWLNKHINSDSLRASQIEDKKKEHLENQKDMKNLIANETHSEYFAVMGAPNRAETKDFNMDRMKKVSGLIEGIIYED